MRGGAAADRRASASGASAPAVRHAAFATSSSAARVASGGRGLRSRREGRRRVPGCDRCWRHGRERQSAPAYLRCPGLRCSYLRRPRLALRLCGVRRAAGRRLLGK